MAEVFVDCATILFCGCHLVLAKQKPHNPTLYNRSEQLVFLFALILDFINSVHYLPVVLRQLFQGEIVIASPTHHIVDFQQLIHHLPDSIVLHTRNVENPLVEIPPPDSVPAIESECQGVSLSG